jgi:hypothetical protein
LPVSATRTCFSIAKVAIRISLFVMTFLVHIYKRAQILAAEIWGCFQGQGLGRFDDIDQLTMFADYR